jgi:hypothetical protein
MSILFAWDEFPRAIHYHIQWSRTDVLDWECFATPSAAELAARSLVQPGEQYTIQKEGEDCSRCATFVGLRGGSQKEPLKSKMLLPCRSSD